MEIIKGHYKIIIDNDFLVVRKRESYTNISYKIPISDTVRIFGRSLEELLQLNDSDFDQVIGKIIYDLEVYEVEILVGNLKIEAFPKEDKFRIINLSTSKSTELTLRDEIKARDKNTYLALAIMWIIDHVKVSF